MALAEPVPRIPEITDRFIFKLFVMDSLALIDKSKFFL
jgi:hypothetical protein